MNAATEAILNPDREADQQWARIYPAPRPSRGAAPVQTVARTSAAAICNANAPVVHVSSAIAIATRSSSRGAIAGDMLQPVSAAAKELDALAQRVAGYTTSTRRADHQSAVRVDHQPPVDELDALAQRVAGYAR